MWDKSLDKNPLIDSQGFKCPASCAGILQLILFSFILFIFVWAGETKSGFRMIEKTKPNSLGLG